MWWEWSLVGCAVAWAGAMLGRRVWRLATDFLATGPARADAASACGHCGACGRQSPVAIAPGSSQTVLACATTNANLPLVTLSLPAVPAQRVVTSPPQ